MSWAYCIGIDPGTKTGLCVWQPETKAIRQIRTVKIHEAMEGVTYWAKNNPGKVIVVVEDARQATFGRQIDFHKAQGAGSVKRDCAIWDDFLEFLKVDYRMVRPKKASTKLSVPAFKSITKHTGTTSNHARDACMLVFGM